jgi:hypothetical protein
MTTHEKVVTKACGRKACTDEIPAGTAKKYCSSRCARNASLVRRRARANIPLEKAVASSTQYTMKKLMQSAAYLADSYKVDVEEVKEMLVNDMERRFDKFWDAEVQK